MVRGRYIVFEGIVGSGKTTQSKLLAQKLGAVWTREPGGSEVADAIRKVVQGTEFEEEMDPVCEQYLYAASRAQTLRKIVKPVLDKGGVVVADRSVFSSIAFQGFGRGLGFEKVMEINKIAVGDMWPDVVIFLDVNLDTVLARINDKEGDKFERMGKEFWKKVIKGYKFLAKKYDFVKVVNGNGSVEEVEGRIWDIIGE